MTDKECTYGCPCPKHYRNDPLVTAIRPLDVATDMGTAELRTALERARVVQVLDNWGAAHGVLLVQRDAAYWAVLLNGREFRGATPDEARAKAAQAIEQGEV